MKSQRRNTLTTLDIRVVIGIALVSGVLAAFAGCQPTGEAVPDALLTAGFAIFVAWAAASAPWWALVVASASGALLVVDHPLLMAAALAAFGASIWIGLQRTGVARLRAAIGAVVVQAILRSESNPWFLASGLAAAAVAGLLIITGVLRRPAYVRRRVLFGGIGVIGFALLAGAGLVAGGLSAKSHAIAGYHDLLSGLNSLRGGEPADAAKSLRSAAHELNSASDRLSAPWTHPARLVPVLAQHRAAADIMGKAAAAAIAAADTLDLVDLDQLTVQSGVIDVEALALLAKPLGDLQSTVDGLAAALDDTSSPWLLGQFQARLGRATTLAREISRQAETSATAAQQGPALLGIDGPRRYFMAFTSSAEVRGQTGLMGNWAEITIDRGRMRLSAKGRTSELIAGLDKQSNVTLSASEEFFRRYGQFGAGTPEGAVAPKFWSNITMSPDTPTVGSSMAQLYQQATGRTVDGVFIIDPAGIAALLDLAGPVMLPELGVSLSSSDVEQFLLLDQYARPESEREDILAAVTEATVDQVLGSPLPGPQVLAADLSPAATQGHISAWASRPDDQRLFTLAGIDAALPSLDGHDGLAVVNDNASANKIDSFLKREVRYEATFDEQTGHTGAVASVTLTNTAPSTGYPDYVIGNRLELPKGTNRTILSLYSPLSLQGVTLDGESIGQFRDTELGWNVYSTLLTLAPGERVTVKFALEGDLEPGTYQLVYRPQPLRLPERLFATTVDSRGRTIAGYAGTLKRRSVLSGQGLEAWR